MTNTDPAMSSPNINSSPENERLKPLYRGIWANRLEEGDELPVGGSIFSNRLILKLKLDFANLNIDRGKINPEHFQNVYAQSEEALKGWLAQIGSNIDPYLFFVCNNIQNITNLILKVDPSQGDEPDQRITHYKEGDPPEISSLKGKTRCSERAALAQYLLQEVGIESTYIGGLTMVDAHDEDEYPEPHSFILINSPTDGRGYIFDVARPKSSHNLPRIMTPVEPVTYELFSSGGYNANLLVKCTDNLPGNPLYFWGRRTSGRPARDY